MDEAGEEGQARPTLQVFDLAPVGVLVTRGREHRLVYTNGTYRATFGERPLGTPIREAFGDLMQQDYFDLFDGVLATGRTVNVTEAPVRLSFPGTGRRERFFSFSLSRFEDGEPGVLAVAAEVTEQVIAARRAGDMAETRRRLLHRFQSLVQVSAEIVWVTGTDGEPIEPSPGWERVTGQGWEEFRGTGWLRALHPEDREPTRRSWAEARRSADPWRHVYRLRTVEGDYRHFEVNAAPVYEGGEVTEWVGTCSDVEQRWRRQRRRELLGRAAVATAEHTGLREMLGALADVLVPALADGCGVHLLPEFTERPANAPVLVRRIATAARSELAGRLPLGEEWFAADSGFMAAVRRRRPLRRTFPPGRPPVDLLPASSAQWMVDAGAHSMVLLPVIVDGAVAAVVTASACGDRPPMSDDDVDLIGQMFDHAHDALSTAMRYQRTQRVALALQHSLLADPPEVPGLDIVARYRASPAAADVGGDWYDSFVLRDGATVLVIGDVAGHDLAAAVGMSQLRNMLRGLAVDRQEPPGDILRRLNIAMEALAPESTATCILSRIEETGEGGLLLNFAVAGHPPPILVTPGAGARLLDEAVNPLLGLLVDQTYLSAVEPLPPRSTLLLYTDGLVEHPGENLEVGLARLRRKASELAAAPLHAFCDGILTDLPTTGTDDIAVIAARVPE
ncbi:SpoIIE family protein phosphatase [Actinomadura bangladeshensis]|uniref:SpoIIE family protein phosphatase n=1 Tax=Actinomadura bangladeshensis TaxID=453573 RepID=A0A6L9Q8X8_9ACTN|nr:SpoIIE family protein phosphatase [Actinomadura bangladeshensis]NEA21891.1 SpoIIE family protein phosphatase [Actinomadura bangladeshensis]